ncbi:MAG: EAL domain-containing protein [Magnetococcales bacterium]|nr:EAL domain-containing protein [Magnetococcales bacterium]
MSIRLWIFVILPAMVLGASCLLPWSPLPRFLLHEEGMTTMLLLYLGMVTVSWLAFRSAYSGFALGRGLFSAGHSPESIRKAIFRARISTQERYQLVRQLRREVQILKEKEQELDISRQVLLHLKEGVVITDPQGTVTSINAAFTDITGYAEGEILGLNMRLLHSGRQSEKFYVHMWQDLLSRGLWTGNLWNKRKNGNLYPQWTVIKVIRNRDGQVSNLVGILSDLTAISETEQQIEFIAHYDPLTELPNRILFKDRLNQAIAHARRDKQWVGILWVGLDRFQQVNANGGRYLGDQVLKTMAQRLKGGMRGGDTIARIGGDEFAILINHAEELSQFGLTAEKVLSLVGSTLQFGEHTLHFSASIGITAFPMDDCDAESMLKHAETAMKQAKIRGGNHFKFYTQEMGELAMQRWNLDKGLKRALERKEFFLLYQPQFCVRTGAMVGVEALVRWQSPQFGLVSPGQFISLAEENGLIVPIGEWILKEACLQNKRWQEAGLPPIHMAVNVSPRQFQNPNLESQVEQALKISGLDPQWLELEITESLFLEDQDRAIAVLNRWRERNLRISIDDFGTGYSSLSYLRNYPVHTLKIDRSFINDIAIDSESAAIANAILSIARSLKLKVVAEGVATPQQLEFLRRSDCDKVQGFLFSPPVGTEEITTLLHESPRFNHSLPHPAATSSSKAA